jgi:protocatechuate 3,4-dioxygenase beta subunit
LYQANRTKLSRRDLLKGIAVLPSVGLVACSSSDPVGAPSPVTTPTPSPAATPVTSLSPTAACTDDDDPTPAQTEGPYFTPNSPLRSSLVESGMAGTRLTVSGLVLSTSCQPIAQALLDFWQADNSGNYDNSGYRLRGHQFTDASGRFVLDTIVPGLYPGRTRHIHVKVQPPNGRILTTQLYFPGESRNSSDGIFNSELVLTVQGSGNPMQATFNFVVTA